MYYTFFEPFPILDRNQDCCDNTVIIKKEHSKKLISYLSAFLRQNMHKKPQNMDKRIKYRAGAKTRTGLGLSRLCSEKAKKMLRNMPKSCSNIFKAACLILITIAL